MVQALLACPPSCPLWLLSAGDRRSLAVIVRGVGVAVDLLPWRQVDQPTECAPPMGWSGARPCALVSCLILGPPASALSPQGVSEARPLSRAVLWVGRAAARTGGSAGSGSRRVQS